VAPPAAPFRPAWAGQLTRLGCRYTRWSNGTWDFGVPLAGAAVMFGVVGITCGALLRWRRGRGPKGFPVFSAEPGS
jgi:hypothetical protein